MGAGDRTDEEYDAAGSLNSKQKAATDALWAKLNGGGCAGAKGKAKGAEAGSGSSDASAKGRAALDILSKLNRTSAGKVVKPGAKGADASRAADDKNWQRLLGVGSGGKSGAPKAKAPLTEAQLEARARCHRRGRWGHPNEGCRAHRRRGEHQGDAQLRG